MGTAIAVVVGWSLVVLVVVDVFRTVLWPGQGAGPLTGAVTGLGRRLLPLLPGGRTARSAVGPIAIVVVVSLWSMLLLAGFTLVLEGDPEAIRTSSTQQPVGRLERAYFVGYSIFTLGNGDLAPVTDAGRFLTVAISATGLFLITLSVTYLLPVISASVASRAFASSARSLGADADAVVVGAWDGERIQLDHQLRDLSSALGLLAERQLAYPVLHLFRSADPDASAPLAVARLDEVLTLLDGVEQRAAPTLVARRQLRSAIASYLAAYDRGAGGSEASPPPPSTDRLASAGIPVLEPATYERVVAALDDHRAEVRDLARSAAVEDR